MPTVGFQYAGAAEVARGRARLKRACPGCYLKTDGYGQCPPISEPVHYGDGGRRMAELPKRRERCGRTAVRRRGCAGRTEATLLH